MSDIIGGNRWGKKWRLFRGNYVRLVFDNRCTCVHTWVRRVGKCRLCRGIHRLPDPIRDSVSRLTRTQRTHARHSWASQTCPPQEGRNASTSASCFEADRLQWSGRHCLTREPEIVGQSQEHPDRHLEPQFQRCRHCDGPTHVARGHPMTFFEQTYFLTTVVVLIVVDDSSTAGGRSGIS